MDCAVVLPLLVVLRLRFRWRLQLKLSQQSPYLLLPPPLGNDLCDMALCSPIMPIMLFSNYAPKSLVHKDFLLHRSMTETEI